MPKMQIGLGIFNTCAVERNGPVFG